MVGGVTPYTLNFGSTGPRWSEIADFEPIIARSASAAMPSEKSSINTKEVHCALSNERKMIIHRTLPLSPQMGLKSVKLPFFL